MAAGNTAYQLGTVVKEHTHKAVGHDESNRAGIAFDISISTTYTDELYMIDAGSSGLSLYVAEQILVVNVIEQANGEKWGRDRDV